MEDAKDADLNLDFGFQDGANGYKGGYDAEKNGVHRPGQLSMDMNLSSPYLLPPTAAQSHESIHSMARSFQTDEQDPYRTVPLYSGNGDAASIRSKDRAPPFTSRSSSKRQSLITSGPGMMPPPPRKNSLHQSVSSIGAKSDPFATPTAPEPTHQLPAPGEISDFNLPVQPVVPELDTAYPDHSHRGLDMPDVQSPPPVLAKDDLPSPPADHGRFELPELPPVDHTIGAAHGGGDANYMPQTPQELEPSGLGLNVDIPTIMSPEDALHADGMHPAEMQGHMYAEYDSQPQIHTEYYDDAQVYDGQYEYQDYDQQYDGLGVPQVEAKRHSIGLRPLPPDEITESEDPEYRANRIRSFYKEYFEDTSNAPPMPGQEYYEDYDANYLGDAAYYDAETNAFVMPYAQPVTRRAMTPPPGGRRGPPMGGPRSRGPRGPGSVGGMSMPGRPRAGTSASGAYRRAAPKKKLAPLQALSTLPTPSKLKDDSFAIFNAADFAPPTSFKDQAAGRSQSPLGERRPYQKPSVPAASPLVTAFDELSALPSPHMLRKSNTFTNLDFAPPKKFKDNEASSDAGSIRSNRSGISAVQLGAIRAGAGRVSRLPGDTVFTSASLQDQLKPQWSVGR